MFKKYKRVAIAELREITSDEVASRNLASNISVSPEDLDKGSPKFGDMIARNPKNHNDQWLVAKDYFKDNFVALEVSDEILKAAKDLIETAKDTAGELAESMNKDVTDTDLAIYARAIELEKLLGL